MGRPNNPFKNKNKKKNTQGDVIQVRPRKRSGSSSENTSHEDTSVEQNSPTVSTTTSKGGLVNKFKNLIRKSNAINPTSSDSERQDSFDNIMSLDQSQNKSSDASSPKNPLDSSSRPESFDLSQNHDSPKWKEVKKKIKNKETSEELENYQKKQSILLKKIVAFQKLEALGALNPQNEEDHKKMMKEIQQLTFEAEGDLAKIKKALEAENDKESLKALKDLVEEEDLGNQPQNIDIMATESKIGKKKRHKELSKVLEPESKKRLEKDLERLQIILNAKLKKKKKEGDDDEGYNRWLSENGFDSNTSEKQVLASFGHNWFKLKDDLAFKNKSKKESSAEYSIKLAAMDKILRFRKKEVDSILAETKKAIAEKYAIPEASIEAGAFGSITPTSDYDITFSVLGNPELETDCVEYFNESFKKKFGVSSGVLFDTNVYTSGFMTEGYDKDFNETDYIDQFNPLKIKTSELPEPEQKIIQEGEKAKHQTQIALSYVAIRQALNDKEWDNFKMQTNFEVNQKSKSGDLDAARKDLDEIFEKANFLNQETKDAIDTEKAKLTLNLPGANEEDIKMHKEGESKDKLYVDSLRNASQKLMRIEAIRKELQQDEDTPDRAKLLTDLKNNIIDFETEQGKALIYANEAYFSGGAAVHVVKGMQGGAGVELSPQQRMQSLIMNIGYKVNHFNHQEKDGLGKAHLNTSKYGQRIAHGLANGAGGDLTKDLSDDAQKLLKLDNQLISDVKKNDIQHQTPSKKETQAEETMKGLDGEKIKNAYLDIAAKSVANLYANRGGAWAKPSVGDSQSSSGVIYARAR